MFSTIPLKKIYFLFLFISIEAQEYSEEESDSYGRPDYSKYYSVIPKDGSIGFSPAGGFNGFGPFEAFGASNQKQKLIPTNGFEYFSPKKFATPSVSSPPDFFEQSQSRRQEKHEGNEEISSEKLTPGPHYISHEIPTEKLHEINTVKVPTENNEKLTYRSYKDHFKPSIPMNQQQFHHYPKVAGYQTPHQKYSFQPTDYQQPAGSEVSKKKCKKVKKSSGSKKIGDLTCYVCENPETNYKTTECSYKSDPENTDLHRGSSERYSVPLKSKSQTSRYRRYAASQEDEEEEKDPYEYIKELSLSAQNNDEKENEQDDYYGFENEETQPERSYSEIQSEEILKDAKKCTDVEKDGMSCRVCKDPATGGNFESCSFSRQKKPEKYAYVSEKNYNSDDDPDEVDETQNIPKNITETPLKPRKNTKKASERPKGSKSEYTYDYPQKNYDKKDRYYSEDDTKSSEEEDEEKASPYEGIGEYQFEYFPNSEEQSYEASNTKDVEDVLADFQTKNRSQCTETKKKGMTCFLCIDENKVKNEECMFVSENQPRGFVKKYSRDDLPSSESEVMETAASSEIESVVKAPRMKTELRASESARDSRRVSNENEKDEDPNIETPEEFQTTGEDGAFSAETKPVYSRTLGMSLPKYMLEKSEFEKEFDEFSTNR